MDVSYKRLWKLLIDRDMKKKDLAEKANLSNYTINKMNKGENVNTDTLVTRIGHSQILQSCDSIIVAWMSVIC